MRKFLVVIALFGLLVALPAAADEPGSLFVNLTTDEGHRADMAMAFSGAMIERKHPVTIWLNDKGVLMAGKSHASRFGPQQDKLAELMAKGATVIVCPFCMKHYGIKESDLIDGAKLGNPDLTSSLLFKQGTQTLSW